MARGRPPATGNLKKAGKERSDNKNQILVSEQWHKWKSFGTFVIGDQETGEPAYKFKRGDIAAILPHGRNPGEELEMSDYWLGVIKDIRAEIQEDDMNTASVWAKVNWYYSGSDVKGVIKSFDETAVGKFERIEAEHEDIVASECFESVVRLIKFDERDPEQGYIPRDQFYWRYSFELKARTVKPKPGSSGCICLKPYDPNDMAPSRVMHFCPRPSCRKVYHQDCLIDAKSTETLPPEPKSPKKTSSSAQKPALSRNRRSARKHASPVKNSIPSRSKSKVKFEEPDGPQQPNASTSTAPSPSIRALRLLACSPDTDDPVDLESLVPLEVVNVTSTSSRRGAVIDEDDSDTVVIAQPPRKKRKGVGRHASSRKVSSSSQPQAQIQEPRSLSTVLSEIPNDLLEIAQQPMVRGGAFVRGGVSGNIGFVTRARRLVYKILEGEKTVAELLERVAVAVNADNTGLASKSPGASVSANGASGSTGGGTMNMARWEEEVFGPERMQGWDVDEENAVVRIAGTKKPLPALVCPNCKSSI